jgi:hypothetical protein
MDRRYIVSIKDEIQGLGGTRSGKCTSAASSQGVLVHQDTLKTTRELKRITMLILNIAQIFYIHQWQV